MLEISHWRFLAGDFSLDDAPRLGRPVEVGSDTVETVIENNQRSTTWEIADILKISILIKLLVKVKMCLSFYGKTKHTFWSTQYLTHVLTCYEGYFHDF